MLQWTTTRASSSACGRGKRPRSRRSWRGTTARSAASPARTRRHGHDPLVCREFVELVTDYLEGTLPATERARFEAHLAECDGCSGYLEDIRRLAGTLRETPEPPPDPETRDALLRAFRDLRGDA